MALFSNACLTHFRIILKGRMKQTSEDIFLKWKTPVDEIERNVTKRIKINV